MATKNNIGKQEQPIRGNWEVTLRNLRALKKKMAELEVRVKELEDQAGISYPTID